MRTLEGLVNVVGVFGEGREIWFARKRGSEDERDGAVAAETLAHCLLPAVRQWSANVSPSSPSTTANVPLRYISTSKQVERGEVSVSVSATLSLLCVRICPLAASTSSADDLCQKKGGKITRRKYNRMVDHAVQQTPL